MFGIDFSEILVIFGIALVVLGPERLPKLAATIGRWIGRARAMARQFKDQLEQEAGNLQRSVDLGPELSGRPAARPATPTIRPVAPAHTSPAHPSADATPLEAAGSGADSVPDLAAPTAVAVPSTPAVAAEEFGLADTYPAALNDLDNLTASHPSSQPSEVRVAAQTPPAAPSTASPSTGVAPTTATPTEPHQQAFWPPDGLP